MRTAARKLLLVALAAFSSRAVNVVATRAHDGGMLVVGNSDENEDKDDNDDPRDDSILARSVGDASEELPLIASTPSFPASRDLQRRQAEGDFSALNEIFSEISLRLPDATVSQSGLDLTISQLTCTDLRVEDVRLSHVNSPDDDTSVEMRLDVSGLSVECTLRWDYRWTIFSGGGTGFARLDPVSSASVSVTFVSPDYDERPPRDAVVSACDAPVQIADMSFDGDGLGMIGGIIDLFEGLLRGTVEGRVRDAACDELRKLAGEGDEGSGGALDYLLLDVGDRIRSNLEPLGLNLTNPMWVERNEIIPTSTTADGEIVPAYLNFREVFAREWIDSALDQLRSYLGQDPSGPEGELGINVLLRENFLDEGGRFDVDPSLFFDSAGGDGVIFQGHDVLTETTLSIPSIKIQGLDSFLQAERVGCHRGLHVAKHAEVGSPVSGRGDDSRDEGIVQVRCGLRIVCPRRLITHHRTIHDRFQRDRYRG